MSYYRIIIPSRLRLKAIKRSGNDLFPSATIVVADDERLAYESVVDSKRIVTHPNLLGYTKIFNWCQSHFQEECLFFVDDDVRAVRAILPPGSRKLDSNGILTVIENAFQAITDLDMTVCCFSRTKNWTVIDPWNAPIVPVQFPTVGFGIRGAARNRRSDESLIGRADMDWGLRTLRDDRAVYADIRYFFDNGSIFAGEGGNVGIVDEAHRKRITEELQRRWGRYIPTGQMGFQKSREVVAMRIKVPRKNSTAIS